MKKVKQFEQVLKVLDLRLERLEAQMQREQITKRDLRQRQIDNIDKSNRVVEAFDGAVHISSGEYRWRHLQLQKLSLDQKRLQPELAKAALRRMEVQEKIRAVLHQRLAITLSLEESREQYGHTEEERIMALLQLAKRNQFTS